MVWAKADRFEGRHYILWKAIGWASKAGSQAGFGGKL